MFDDSLWPWLWLSIQNLFDISSLARESLEGITINQRRRFSDLLNKSVQEDASVLDESVIFVSSGFLGRDRSDVDSRPVSSKMFSEGVEVVVSSRSAKFAFFIDSFYCVCDMTRFYRLCD